MLKKLVTLLICSMLTFSLAACDNQAKATESKDTKVEEQKKQEEVKKQQESNAYEDVAVADRENNTPNNAENKVQNENLVSDSIHRIADEKNKMNTNRVVNATVIQNIDGDTLKVKLENGKEETVRFLLVDTPETKHPRLGVQPFGPEASAFTKKYASEGKKIQLELDVSDREKYGRLLAYVWVDGQMLNRLLVERGLARVAYVYAPNTKYVDYLREFQKQAQASRKGIWSIENYATDKCFDKSKTAKPATSAPAPKQSQPEQSQAQTKTEQTQQQPNNNLPQGQYHFSSCKEAKAAGFSNIQKGHPAYSSKLDRDGDGIACDK